MKIIILILIIYFFTVVAFFSCNPTQPTKPYKSGKFTLRQTYRNNTIDGSIYFYEQGEFYTSLSAIRNSYVYSKISSSQIKVDCTNCSASYTFTVSNIQGENETWTAHLNGSSLIWEIVK